jgi:hypothetical protein
LSPASGVGLSQNETVVDVAGLWQRSSVVIGWAWLTLLAIRSRPRMTSWILTGLRPL